MASSLINNPPNSYTPPGTPPGSPGSPQEYVYPTKFDPRNPEQEYRPELPFCSSKFIPGDDYKDAVAWLNDPKKHHLYAVSINNTRARSIRSSSAAHTPGTTRIALLQRKSTAVV
jgi:hypothetical protein